MIKKEKMKTTDKWIMKQNFAKMKTTFDFLLNDKIRIKLWKKMKKENHESFYKFCVRWRAHAELNLFIPICFLSLIQIWSSNEKNNNFEDKKWEKFWTNSNHSDMKNGLKMPKKEKNLKLIDNGNSTETWTKSVDIVIQRKLSDCSTKALGCPGVLSNSHNLRGIGPISFIFRMSEKISGHSHLAPKSK